LWRI
jgi:hypothetical protein